ncbi:hypothetical protein N7520_002313 [Penicillium odoratum]|uniref:uncharacterized protein n=1 Tax=Penicillium odoratum TaxID=1167516 RepID=UPI002547DF7B|nr:uncharacterized protein N7520_002313 [Penicillium odoratum]KAJ5771784.1 hypothetical protein N7520_002313 [Penicillium odoratum]
MKSHCTTGGWVLGNLIDGTQAELPGNVDAREMAVFSDAFPTGMECGTLNANVQPGSSVVIVGAGPVGLSAMLTAKLYTPYPVVILDKQDTRLELAKNLGADKVINVDAYNAMEELDSVVEGKGFDCVIEAVGTPTTFDLCQKLVAPGGSVANIGVHGQKVTLDLDRLWDHNITTPGIKTKLVDTVTIPTLLRLFQAGRIQSELLTHHYPFSDISNAYEAFQKGPKEGVMKVGIFF